jgi:hypothetical protein
MISYILLSMLLVAVTVLIHAGGTSRWLAFLVARFKRDRALNRQNSLLLSLAGTGLILLILHAVQILLWALAYMHLLPPTVLDTLEEATYFSFVTFTTLGYGDITLTGPWRIMSGIEALNGILLVGWSTAMLFAVVQRSWQNSLHATRDSEELQ